MELLPITAWRAIGDLRSEAAVEPLTEFLQELSDEIDEWATEDLPLVFGKIGEPSVDPLIRVANNVECSEVGRRIAVRSLEVLVPLVPTARDRITDALTGMLERATADHNYFNSVVMGALVDMRVVAAAPAIERAFSANLIDTGYMGDWNEVRRELGVEGLNLPQPERPHDSLDDHEEDVDHEGRRAVALFPDSEEGKLAASKFGDTHWYYSFLEHAWQYGGESLPELSLRSVNEYLLDFVPAKVTVEASRADEIIGELTLFWKFLDREFQHSAAPAVIQWLERQDLPARLRSELSNTRNFGMAKSFSMMGQAAGFDMSTPEGMNQFMAVYNASRVAASELRRAEMPREPKPPQHDDLDSYIPVT